MSKAVLITGCSSGFGLYAAARLAAKKYRVIATMRNLDKKTSLLSELNKREASIPDIIALDVTDSDSIQKCREFVSKKYGHLDILVNNAGYGLGGFFEDLGEQQIRDQMDVNFFGVQNVTREFIPLMRQRAGAKIINISSVSGFSTAPFVSAYCASKWALEAFSESLRYELKLFDIDVLLIEPGTYPTKIFFENVQRGIRTNDPDSPYFDYSEFLDNKVTENAKNCFRDPEDIAVLIEKLIKAKHPPFRSIPDTTTQIIAFLRKILPFDLYSYLVQKIAFMGYKSSSQ